VHASKREPIGVLLVELRGTGGNPAVKILIVEDEIFVAMHLEEAFEDLGCEVIGIAPDTETALELGKQEPSVAVVDLNLRDGFTGPLIARELANRYGTKVYYLTGNPREAGEPFDGLLGVKSKPWDEKDLHEIVEAAKS
jgi:CheY-like chemotaxis protein